jgi:hypothetical protein
MDQVGAFVKFLKAKQKQLVLRKNFKRLKWIRLVPL